MYDMCFRKKVLSANHKDKLSVRVTAARFEISTRTVLSWMKNPIPKKTRNKPATKINMN